MTLSTAAVRALHLVTLTLAVCAPAPLAIAQPEKSPNELRVENDALKERIEDLEAQLAQAQERIDSLENTIQRLREQLRDRREQPSGDASEDAEPAAPAYESAPIPDDRFASIASMKQYLRDAYQTQFAGRAPGEGREREGYIRDVRAWARESVRNARGQVTWTIRVMDVAESAGSRATFTVTIMDTQRDLPIGQPFDIELVGRNAVRLRDGADQLWILEGVLQSEIVVDEQMPTVELAADPIAFIGPFARYEPELAVRSLREAE